MPVVDLLKYDSYGKTSIVNDWVGLYYLWENTPGGRKFRLMYWFVWSFFSRVEVFVGIRIDLYFCCVASSSRLLFVEGGGCPLFVWPTFSLGLMIVMGSGFAEWCTLWLIVNSWRENHENGFLFSVYVFVRRRRSSVIILAGVLVIGSVDLLWRWIPSFGLVGLGFLMLPCAGVFEGCWIW